MVVVIVSNYEDIELANDEIFLEKMLVYFVKNNADIYEKISEAVALNDITLAHRLAHNLKSNAGHIKKTSLQEAAQKVESMFKENQVVDTLLQTLKTELETVLEELQPLISTSDKGSGAKSSLSSSEIRQIIDKLEPLLISGNAEYLEYVKQLKQIPGTETLSEHIENFDSISALKTLAKLKKELWES